MPRKARIDAPGALQHIIIRGIEQKTIFRKDSDKKDFLDRLGKLLLDTQTACYAWALMTNHVHLLLRSGTAPISSVMSRLLTGYAVSFNRRYHRYGHLFQNRYKSILCEDEPYLHQLVAYIHLNPYRAGMIENLQALQTYPFSGHCALMGNTEVVWQDTDFVLAVFGKTVMSARKRYADYVSKCASAGRRSELTGGGLIRSTGGWRAVKDAYRDGIRLTSDERILGSSDFVRTTLSNADEEYDRRMRLQALGIDLDAVLEAVCTHLSVDMEEMASPSRKPMICQARALAGYLAVRELRITGATVARRLNVDRSSVSRSIGRVQEDPALKDIVKQVICSLFSEDLRH